jgi:hypothetical protein
MSSELRLRRGTNTEHGSFVGANTEITANTTNKSIHIHDGITAGGFEIARADLNNVSNSAFAAKATAAGVSGGGGATVATISAATAANPVVITTTASHGFVNGTEIQITDVVGMTELNGNSFFVDVLTSTTFALYLDINLQTSLDGTGFNAYVSGGEVAASISSGAPIDASYIVVTAEGGLPNDRRLQASNGIIIVDSGPGGSVSVSANLSSTSPSNLGSAAVGVSNSIARADHVHAMPTATDVGAVPVARQLIAGTGLTGGGDLSTNRTISLNANLNNLIDVNVNNPANGDILIYNSAINKFENNQSLSKNQILRDNVSVVGNTIDRFNFTGPRIAVSVNSSNSNQIDIDLSGLVTDEVIEDIVGAMVSGNTENGISVTYDDPNGKLNFDVNDPVIALTGAVSGSATMTNLGNVSITTTLQPNSVVLGTTTTGNYVSSLTAINGLTLSNSAGPNGSVLTVGINLEGRPNLVEYVTDIVGTMVTGNTENGINVTFDDVNNKLNFDVNDPVIALTGAVSGSATMTNLGNVSITTTLQPNSVVLGTTTTGSFVRTITAGTGISVTGSGGVNANAVVGVNTADTNFIESIEDIVGAMVSGNIENGISVTYDDPNGKLNFDVNDPVIALTGAVTGSAVMTNLGNVSIACTVQNNSHSHTIANITGLQSNLTALSNRIDPLESGNFGTLLTETIRPKANLTHDLGSVSLRWNEVHAVTFIGTSTRAQYADLAERYESDTIYAHGTVVKLGGTKEITATSSQNDTQVLGVISKNPAFIMNDGAGPENKWLPVAMTGRVPVKIEGPVKKGQRIVSSDTPGVAKAVDDDKITTVLAVIGRAMADNNDHNIKLVECIVGKL